MDALYIRGGTPLHGTVAVSGSKNAALPIMAASILADEQIKLRGVPDLTDVNVLALLLGHLGIESKRNRAGVWTLSAPSALRSEDSASRLTGCRAPYRLVRRMRASFCVLGPLLARRGRAIVALPGGCQIGSRPVDLHLQGLAALGAEIKVQRGYVVAQAKRLRGSRISMLGPNGPTVTGTANVLSAATLARGHTTITQAAREPEIVDLGNFLVALGARIEGLGNSTLEIDGVDRLGGADYRIIPDRIEAATLLIAAAITRGAIELTGVVPEHLSAVLEVLALAGVKIDLSDRTITAASGPRLRPLNFTAGPFPRIPTDVQAQLTALATLSGGSLIGDSVFAERFRHVAELRRFGAKIKRWHGAAIVAPIERIVGAEVKATDLRASAALVLAGLAAHGTTVVRGLHHLDRGYERLEDKLRLLGADVWRGVASSAIRARQAA